MYGNMTYYNNLGTGTRMNQKQGGFILYNLKPLKSEDIFRRKVVLSLQVLPKLAHYMVTLF